ncbi:permease [Shewanella intestini]|uniref:Permease n=1 Tax=Shewanella intestini TaxID=2017544 RepID=A0ABS5I502_9GAMM|nr:MULTISPECIES: permease [Shewanella]MBR9729109.1 permease [Shewanella intestini]MRG37185.1 permease [Shewanella sp. XMDDZSB0408]
MSPEIIGMAKETAHMFVFLAAELITLFIVISYAVGILQEYIPPEKIQSILSSKKGKGYIIAALLGAITPFCSCSTIPFLKGLLRAKAGFGPMMVFLFSSPLLNPIIIGLFVVTFGINVAVFYFLVAVVVAVTAGYVLEKLGFERYVKPEAYEAMTTSSCGSSCGEGTPAPKTSCCGETKAPEPATSCCDKTPVKAEDNRWMRVWRSTWTDFKQVFPYLLIGLLLGSVIYGFIPTDMIAHYAGAGTWYAIPIAAVIGIPLYIRAEAVIPLSSALVAKGMALGPVMALIIGSAGASLTEVILLKSIFKNQMIAAFLTVILSMAVGAGYLYSYIFA